MTGSEARIFLIAGEASGDLLGGRLMHALRRQATGPVQFDGIGGETMRAAGLVSRFPMGELSLMGLAEILPHLPRLIRRISETEAAIRAEPPSALITIDAPAFCLRVSRRLQGVGFPRLHYVAPQHWAWRPERARKLASATDRLLALLPFEPDFFAGYGVPCDFVGHPVIEGGAGDGDGAAFRLEHGIGPDQPLLLILPGSRRGEISRLLPIFLESLRRLRRDRPKLAAVIALAPGMEAMVSASLGDLAGSLILVSGPDQRYAAMAAADAALAASGTVALELALAGCPSVIAYRMNAITAAIIARLAKVKFAALPNLIADKMVMQERIQAACEPRLLTADLARLLDDPAAAAMQRSAIAAITAALGADGPAPSERAAASIWRAIRSADQIGAG